MIFASFLEVKGKQNREKMMLQSMLFSNVEFETFFFEFWRFWLDFGRPRGFQKSIKNQKNRVWEAFNARQRVRLVFGRFWKGLGRVLGRFLEGVGKHFKENQDNFGKVLEFCLESFWDETLIRATKKTSMNE